MNTLVGWYSPSTVVTPSSVMTGSLSVRTMCPSRQARRLAEATTSYLRFCWSFSISARV